MSSLMKWVEAVGVTMTIMGFLGWFPFVLVVVRGEALDLPVEDVLLMLAILVTGPVFLVWALVVRAREWSRRKSNR